MQKSFAGLHCVRPFQTTQTWCYTRVSLHPTEGDTNIHRGVNVIHIYNNVVGFSALITVTDAVRIHDRQTFLLLVLKTSMCMSLFCVSECIQVRVALFQLASSISMVYGSVLHVQVCTKYGLAQSSYITRLCTLLRFGTNNGLECRMNEYAAWLVTCNSFGILYGLVPRIDWNPVQFGTQNCLESSMVWYPEWFGVQYSFVHLVAVLVVYGTRVDTRFTIIQLATTEVYGL